MTNETTTTENTATENIEAGAAWVKKDKNGNEFLSLLLNNHTYNAFFAKEKKLEKSPDLNVVEFKENGESDLIGAIWIGETKAGRTKLTIKMNDGLYYTAVKRDAKEDAKPGRADYTIFNPAAQTTARLSEQDQEQQQTAVEDAEHSTASTL